MSHQGRLGSFRVQFETREHDTSSFFLLFQGYFDCCILGISVVSPSLEGVALFRRCPMGLRSTILPGHQSRVLKGSLLCMQLVGPQLQWGCWWAERLLGQLWDPAEMQCSPTGADRLGGGFPYGACQCSCSKAAWDHINGSFQWLRPCGVFQLVPFSIADVSRWVGESPHLWSVHFSFFHVSGFIYLFS